MNPSIYKNQRTGAGGVARAMGGVLVVASMLGYSATGDASLSQRILPERTSSIPVGALPSPASPDSRSSTSRSIMAIRRISNLTWDEVAKLFRVSRRTVHLWANGRHPSSDQERKIGRILGVLSSYQGLSPSSLREQLMASAKPGVLFFDLLCNNEFDTFRSLFPVVGGMTARTLPSQPIEARNYFPPSPVSMLDAVQDRPVADGKAVASKGVRFKRRAS